MSPGKDEAPAHRKRRFKRGYRNLRVRYGMENPEHQATARRLSPTGVFIATNNVVFAKGVRLNLELEIEGSKYRAVGIVRYAIKVESRFVRIFKPGMGIEFQWIEDRLRDAIGKLK